MRYHCLMQTPSKYLRAVAMLLLCLSACAVQHTPSQLVALPPAAQPHTRTLAQETVIKLDTGFVRSLKSGSTWQQVGAIPEGDVYRPVKDVFTLEGANIHEAYLVVHGDVLVGFYLPAERGFSLVQTPVPLRFNH
jgi:hypothetical protein